MKAVRGGNETLSHLCDGFTLKTVDFCNIINGRKACEKENGGKSKTLKKRYGEKYEKKLL